MIEGHTFRSAAATAGSSALVGGAVGAGWVAAASEFTGKLTGEAQVIALQFLGLIIVIAEVGVILIALQSLRAGGSHESDLSEIGDLGD